MSIALHVGSFLTPANALTLNLYQPSRSKKQKLEILGKSSNTYLYKNKCVVDIISNNKIITCLHPLKSLDKIAGSFITQYFRTGKVSKKYNSYSRMII